MVAAVGYRAVGGECGGLAWCSDVCAASGWSEEEFGSAVGLVGMAASVVSGVMDGSSCGFTALWSGDAGAMEGVMVGLGDGGTVASVVSGVMDGSSY